MSNVEQEKSRLENEKLEIELKNYRKRLELQDEKLRLDIRDWYFRSVTFFLAGVVSFFGGMIVQHFREKNDQAFQLQLAANAAKEADFEKNLSLVSASDPGQRASAAAVLEQYVMPPPEATAGKSAPDTEEQKKVNERALEVARVINTRFLTESDMTALQSYSQLLQAIGRPALPYVVAMNARAATQFAGAAGGYVAAHLQVAASFQGDCQSDNQRNQQEVDNLQHDVSLLVARTAEPPLFAAFDSDRLVQAPGFVNRFFYHCRLILDNRADQSKEEQKTERLQTLNQVVNAAHILSASSFTLGQILHPLSGHLAGAKLDGAVLVSKNLDNVDLSGASLKGSYLEGPAKDFVCEGCNFSNSNLENFNPYDRWSLKGSTIIGAQLSSGIQASLGVNKK